MLLLLPAARTPLACVSTCPCLRLQFFLKDLTGMVGGILFASSQVGRAWRHPVCFFPGQLGLAAVPCAPARACLRCSAGANLPSRKCRFTARSVPATALRST